MKSIYTQDRKVRTDFFASVISFLFRFNKPITKTIHSYCLLQRGISHSQHTVIVCKVFTIVTENVVKKKSQRAASKWFYS